MERKEYVCTAVECTVQVKAASDGRSLIIVETLSFEDRRSPADRSGLTYQQVVITRQSAAACIVISYMYMLSISIISCADE